MMASKNNINFDLNNINNGLQLINMLNLRDPRTANGLKQKYLTVRIKNKAYKKNLYDWLVRSVYPKQTVQLKNNKKVPAYSDTVFKLIFNDGRLEKHFKNKNMYKPAVNGAIFYFTVNHLPRMGTIAAQDSNNYINNPKARGDFYGRGRFSQQSSLNESKKKSKDRCHKKADRVYGKKTSAYKSGAIVRCRQGKIWKENTNLLSITESLRDWFKKENWVRINTTGNITGPCGTMKNKKNPSRCLPKARAQSMSREERAATARKKKREGKKGKQFVPVK